MAGFSVDALTSINLVASKFDPNGKVTPYLDGGIQALAQRLSPTTPGVSNGSRSQDQSVTRGPAVTGLQAWWLYLKGNPLILGAVALGLVVVVWLVVRKKKG